MLVVLSLHGVSAQILPPVTVLKNTNPSSGALFLAPNSKAVSPPFAPSLMVVGNDGKPIKSRFLSQYAYDFRILPDGRLGYSVFQSAASGSRQSSTLYILDTNLVTLDSLKGANGYNISMNSFDVLPNGNRLLVMQEDVLMDLSTLVSGGNPAATVQQMLIQELDIDGKIIFQWRSLDHFPVTATNENLSDPLINYFNINSVVVDGDGNFLLSARNASTIVKIHRKTGKILWILGGKLNQFTIKNGTGISGDPAFAYQHDVQCLSNGHITMFDNGPASAQASRAVEYEINEETKTCTLVWQYRKSPDLYASTQGSVQTLTNGNRIISWGSALQANRTIVTELDAANQEVYEIQLPSMMYPYKALRAPYPTGRYSADVLIDEILPTNTYTYTRNADTIGLTITYHTLISFFYNTTTAQRFQWAPENPRFEKRTTGSAPVPIPAPYLIYPCRVTLTQEGMVDHAGEFRFSVDVLKITSPESSVVYYRDSIGKGAFRALPTRYNALTRQLVVDTARAGEFCFGGRSEDLAESIAHPLLISPSNGSSILENTAATLAVSPQGQTSEITYTLVPPVSMPVVEWVTAKDKLQTPKLLKGTYFWKAKSKYEKSESGFSNIDSFVVEAPFLNIKRPAERVVWYQDSSYVISWNTNIDVPVKIDLIKNNTVVTTVKSNVAPLLKGLLWKIPSLVPVGTDYKLRITPMDGSLESIIQETAFTIEIRSGTSSVDESDLASSISIGPNPATSTLYIGGQIPIHHVYVFSISGELLVESVVKGTGESIDVSLLAPGTYILRCETLQGALHRVVSVRR